MMPRTQQLQVMEKNRIQKSETPAVLLNYIVRLTGNEYVAVNFN